MKKTSAMLLAVGALMCLNVGCGDKASSGSASEQNGSTSENDGSPAEASLSFVEEKIDEANSAAGFLENAGSSAMLELETEYGEDVSGIYWLTGKNIGAKGEVLAYGDEMRIKNIDKLPEYVEQFFPEVTELEEAGICFIDGIPFGTYVKTSDGYFGTCPFGLITEEDYDYNMTVEDCVKLIEGEMGE